MHRRSALRLLGGGLLAVVPIRPPAALRPRSLPRALRAEPPARAEVRLRDGGLRLVLNGEEVYPLAGMSLGLRETIGAFRDAGLKIFQPILGLRTGWTGPGRYDWAYVDAFLADLLDRHPDAYFLPRLHLNTPPWWLDAHPTEALAFGLDTPPDRYRMTFDMQPGGHRWGIGADLYEASWASEPWLRDTGAALAALLAHIEASPLAGRVIGYHPTTGKTGEWGYAGAMFLPDTSAPMQRAVGPVPPPEARMTTTYGLLRDPEREAAVIEFYRRFHEQLVDAVLHFAGVVKDATERRVLCGTFHAYLLEKIMIQDLGYLTPERILASPDLDYLAAPYSYIHTNIPGRERWESDLQDDAGNDFGRARGVAGDGAYRILDESLRRHGKLYVVEMDPNTYVEPVRNSMGGSGKDTVEGTLKILERDLAQQFAGGHAGWLFDFGPLTSGPGWYADAPIVDLIRRYAELGPRRAGLNLRSNARIAAVYEPSSYLATAHWKAMEPHYATLGSYYFDFVNHWFSAVQLRALQRLAAPVDYLYRADLNPSDAHRYRLFLFPVCYRLDPEHVDHLRRMLSGSGATVVWWYAPGFVGPDRLDLDQMRRLTGFDFEVLEAPGPLLTEARLPATSGEPAIELAFGVRQPVWPRFAVVGDAAEPLGAWSDGKGTALAARQEDGWRSIYVGGAPLPAEILRRFMREAGLPPWSDRTDIVKGVEDAVSLVATSAGRRTLTLPKPMADVRGGPKSRVHTLDLDYGEVRLFTA